jgi:hypothetical protein
MANRAAVQVFLQAHPPMYTGIPTNSLPIFWPVRFIRFAAPPTNGAASEQWSVTMLTKTKTIFALVN